jgi:ABC-type branched-subunit amino acid transport system substrate-binding protein
MRYRSAFRLAAVLGAVSLAAAACGGTTKSSTVSPAPAPATGGTTGSAAPKEPAAAPGFDPATKTIHVGVISPLTGSVAIIGKPLTAGQEVWFKYVNDQGGIAGKYKVVLDEEDSQYKPDLAVQAYNKLKDGEVMFAQLLGTPLTKAVLPLLKQDNIVAAPASLDADWVAEQNLLPVGGPYQIQMINAASYYLTDGGFKGKTLCSSIQDDAYGQAGQAGIDYAAKQLGFTLATTAKFTAGSPDFTPQVTQLKSANCQLVFLVATPADMAAMMAKAAGLNFTPQWVGQSPTWLGAFAASALKDYLAAHFTVIGDAGPEWGDRSSKGMSDLLDRLQKYLPSQGPDYYFVFGYYEARAVSQVLENAVKLGDLSRAGIIKAMNTVGTLTFDGLSGDYGFGPPGQRTPPRASSLFKVNPAKPAGLEAVKTNFTSDAAKSYKIG